MAGRSTLQRSIGSLARKTGGDRLHPSSRRTILTSSQTTTTPLAARPDITPMLSTWKASTTSRFQPGSISDAARIYLLWASQRRYLSIMPMLRNEYAASQSDFVSATPQISSSTTPPISNAQHQQEQQLLKQELDEEDPRELFWTLFPKADAPEELERIAVRRVQKHSRGDKAEDLLRKSLYLRRPVNEWWGQYEDLSRRWASMKDPVQHLRASSIGGADFVRMIESLKLGTTAAVEPTRASRPPLSPDSDRIRMMERILDDTHAFASVDITESYRALLRTVRFWKEQDQLPAWVDRIRQGIASSSLYPDPATRLSRYHQLMNSLANESELGLLQDCARSIGKDLGLEQPTVDTYNALILGHFMGRDTHRATETFQEMITKGLQPTRSTFNTLIRGYLANRDFLSSQRALESLLLSDIRPDIETFNNLMAGYFNAAQYETGYGFYKGLSEYGVMPNATTYYYLMKSYLQRRETNRVVELFLQMKQSDNASMHPDARVYRLLVQALAQSGRMNDALKVVQEMRSNPDVSDSTTVYNVILNQYARQQQGVRARRVLDWILQRGLVPSQGCFNPLIQLYLETGEYDLAKEMTTRMMEHGVPPSTVTYNLLIKSTKPQQHGRRKGRDGEEEELEAALSLYREMIRQGLEPDVWTFNILLDRMVHQLSPKTLQSHSRRHRSKSQAHMNKRKAAGGAPTAPTTASGQHVQHHVLMIEELLRTMKAAKIRPDHATYCTLIHHYVLLDNIEAAEVLFHDMIKVHGVAPNAHICNTLLNGFVMTGEMDKALELFRRMPKKYGVEPDPVTLTTLIKGYCHRHDLVAAQTFARLLQEDPRLELDQHGFHMLMHLAKKSKQPGLALDFLEMMRARGIEPDHVTYTTLINTLSKRQGLAPTATTATGAAAAASSLNQQQRSERYPPPPPPSSDPYYPHHNDAEAAAAVDTFLEMVQQGKSPMDHTEITTILSAYFVLGRPRAAIEFFKASVRKAEPKVSTSTCGALFAGLLRPEFGRRYDGAVLNLYSRMLTATRQRLLKPVQKSKRREEKEGGDSVGEMSALYDTLLPHDQQQQQQQQQQPLHQSKPESATSRWRGVPISVIRDLTVWRSGEEEGVAEEGSKQTATAFAVDASVMSSIAGEGSSSSSSGIGSGQDLAQVLEQIAGRFGSRYYEEQVRAKEAEAASTSKEHVVAATTPLTSTTTTSITPVADASGRRVPPSSEESKAEAVEEDNRALPNLDLLWRDLASLPVEQLYPHEIPVEVVTWASQAFYRVAAKMQAADQHRRQVESTFSLWETAAAKQHGATAGEGEGEGESEGDSRSSSSSSSSSNSSRQHEKRAEQAQEYMAISQQLLRQVWLQYPMRGREWSVKIYGRDIFSTRPLSAKGSSVSAATSSPLAALSPKGNHRASRRKGGAVFGRRAKTGGSPPV
ncbi:hypothetical protein BGZ73_003271 [Actinomortierella ambigua]|nr:hypothetical protein BGZ73_003271 [Actinomortierella ambigua]